MRLKSLIILAFSVAITYVACKHEIPVLDIPGQPGGITTLPGTSGRACSTDSVYYANDIFPLISSTCAMSGCHDAGTHAEGVDLSTYTKIIRYVNVGNPSGSKLYKEVIRTDNERMPLPPNPAWTTIQKAQLLKWISQGALNNVCDKCDTTDFKYSTAVKPLIQNKCVGCHNSANLSGGINLSTYDGAKAVAISGKLFGSISWASGFSAMPKTLKMPDCEIRTIKKWIDAGTLNN